jgi:hypothetical protein
VSKPLYEPLLAVVALLEAAGEPPVDGGFLNSPGGWYCRMRDPLDLGLVRRELIVPSIWSLSEAHDTILDQSTWCSVLGPGAP